KLMKEVAAKIGTFNQSDIALIEQTGQIELAIAGSKVVIERDDVEIISEDIPGWLVANEGDLTVAIDITINAVLRSEGFARDLVNRIQNLRKEKDFELTDKINVRLKVSEELKNAIHNNLDYICGEILAERFEILDNMEEASTVRLELEEGLEAWA